jgi:hypothetical protein
MRQVVVVCFLVGPVCALLTPACDRPNRDRPASPVPVDDNGDGYVSRREFPGTDEQFRQIDTAGDGLISLEEAEKADARFRKKK